MSIQAIDPFGVAGDPEMPSLALALEPVEVQRQFACCLPRLTGERGSVHLRAIRVTRHKPGRRCVIEYDVAVEQPKATPKAITMVGKVRARRSGKAAYRLLRAFWNSGFQSDSRDGVSVPRPIGKVSELQMWLQLKVPGRVATDLLAEPDGVSLARQIAEAAHKIHRAGVSARRCPSRRPEGSIATSTRIR